MDMLYSMDIPSTDSLNALYPTGNHWIPGVQFNNGVPAEQAMEIPDTRERTNEVLALEAQISDLEAQLIALHLQKDLELASQSMIARVPPEVLSQIFVLCVSYRQRMIACLPLVCRLWREVVLTTPALHTSICYKEAFSGWYPNGLPTYDHIPLLLDRSRDSRLSVHINFRADQNALEQFVTALSPHMGRVNVFNLSAAGLQWARVFREHCAVHLGPSLEDLTLYLGRVTTDPEWVSSDSRLSAILDPEEIYLHLCKLTLDHAALHDLCVVSMPHLRTLEIGQGQGYGGYSPAGYGGRTPAAFGISTWLTFLRGVPELETLKISGMIFLLDADAVGLFAGPERVHMHALKSISLNQLSGDVIFMCLSGMGLPVLDTLSLNTTDISYLAAVFGDAPFPCLKTLILPELSMHGCNLLPFVRALHSLPMLTTLGIKFAPELHYMPGMNAAPNPWAGMQPYNILSAPTFLSPRADGQAGWLLPRLSMLAVGGQVNEEVAAQLLKIVRARSAAWSLSASGEAHGIVEPSLGTVSKIRCLRIPRRSILEAATIASLRDSVEEFQH